MLDLMKPNFTMESYSTATKNKNKSKNRLETVLAGNYINFDQKIVSKLAKFINILYLPGYLN